VIVRFVDIVGMDDHHFLLIDLKLLNPRYPMCMLLRGHGDKKKKVNRSVFSLFKSSNASKSKIGCKINKTRHDV
jgi:GTP cyclohydrolase I